MEKAEGKRPLGTPNVKLQDSTDWMSLAQNMDSLQAVVTNNETLGLVNYGEFIG